MTEAKRRILSVIGRTILVTAVLTFMVTGVRAEATTPQKELETCMKRAEELPDMAIADAEAWLKRGGEDGAHLCHATALYNAERYADAAPEFAALAAKRSSSKKVATLFMQAGMSYASAKQGRKAEEQFAEALKLEKNDPDIWFERARERATFEKYWDAIDDLNRALIIEPDMAEALRLRGRCWLSLSNVKKAQEDFINAEKADAEQAEEVAPQGPKQ